MIYEHKNYVKKLNYIKQNELMTGIILKNQLNLNKRTKTNLIFTKREKNAFAIQINTIIYKDRHVSML